jgi:transcriptional regulator with XRE-family HTH domain
MAKRKKAKPVLNGQRSAGKYDVELGKRIRIRRVEQNISQAELGAKLGVSFQQVQKYEKGVNRVGSGRLQQIADALQVPVTYFYDEGDKGSREVESLLFQDSHFSLRLLRAYNGIQEVIPAQLRHVARACRIIRGMREVYQFEGELVALKDAASESVPGELMVRVTKFNGANFDCGWQVGTRHHRSDRQQRNLRRGHRGYPARGHCR